MPAVLLALDAEIHVKGPKGWRMVKAVGVLQGPVHGGPGGRRDHRERAVRSGAHRGLRQAAPARVALRHRRRRGGARRERWHDRVGPHRPDRSDVACVPAARTSSRRSTGQPLSAKAIEGAAQMAGQGLEDVNADIHASADYRRAMIPVFTRRALLGGAGASVVSPRSWSASPASTRRSDRASSSTRRQSGAGRDERSGRPSERCPRRPRSWSRRPRAA